MLFLFAEACLLQLINVIRQRDDRSPMARWGYPSFHNDQNESHDPRPTLTRNSESSSSVLADFLDTQPCDLFSSLLEALVPFAVPSLGQEPVPAEETMQPVPAKEATQPGSIRAKEVSTLMPAVPKPKDDSFNSCESWLLSEQLEPVRPRLQRQKTLKNRRQAERRLAKLRRLSASLAAKRIKAEKKLAKQSAVAEARRIKAQQKLATKIAVAQAKVCKSQGKCNATKPIKAPKQSAAKPIQAPPKAAYCLSKQMQKAMHAFCAAIKGVSTVTHQEARKMWKSSAVRRRASLVVVA